MLLKRARRLLGETAYDLLLFDVTLPDGNGFSLCEELREGSNLVPVIFLTAADEEYSVIRGLDIGGDDYITKPFRLANFSPGSMLCSEEAAHLRRQNIPVQSPPPLAHPPPLPMFLRQRLPPSPIRPCLSPAM